jgi:adenylate cyclase
MTRRSDSTLARIDLAQRNEEQVLAENSLQGERLVAWVRLALLLLIALSQTLGRRLEGLEPERSFTPRMAAVLLYLLFTLITLRVVTRRKRGDPLKARWAGVLLALADYLFYGFMGIRFSVESPGSSNPEMGAAVLGLAIVFSVARSHWLHVFLSTFLSCATYLTVIAFEGRLASSVSSNLFVLGCFTALGLLVGLTRQRVRRMFLELRRRDNLTRFLPPQVAERVMSLGDGALAPVQREVTVMFTDIRDFTRFSEKLPPAAVLRFLDEYFGHMSRLVKAHDGIVNKFLGDGMLAVWGVPEHLERHAEMAVRCALDMRRVVEELNAVRQQSGAPPIRIGIGIHTGVVAAGMLGGSEQHEYTVIGDAVNLASRIEGLTKTFGVDVLVSASTWEQLEGRFTGERVGESQVKGREEAVTLYRLDGRASDERQRSTG